MISPQERTLAIIAGRYDPSTDTGYYGFVDSTNLITGDLLAKQLDFNVGINRSSDAGWLKFYVGPNAVCNNTDHQRVIYVARTPLKYSVSWDDINNADLIFGNRNIDIGNNTYQVRLLTGGNERFGTGSEWNELLYRVCIARLADGGKWDIYDDMGLHSGLNGLASWAPEIDGSSTFRRVIRGYSDITTWNTAASSHTSSYFGWRPVLELV